MLQLEGIGRTVAGQHLFRNVTWTLHPGDRVGLVGANGSGKSSLLRILARCDEPDEGKLHIRSGLRTAYLPQEIEAEISDALTVLQTVLAGAEEVRQLGRELAALEQRIPEVEGGELERLTQAYGEKRALFEWFGGDQLETRAKIVCGGLGFRPEEFDQPLKVFSGGWRMRAVIGRMLLSGADLLLLDEPTNHLDLDALAWLESELASTPAALIIVSHDRVFLDRVVTRIAELSRERVRVTPGGYSAWARRRALENEQAVARARRLQSEADRLERFVDRFRAKATKATQAQDRARMLEQVKEQQSEIEVERARTFRVQFPKPPDCGDPLVVLEGVEKRYGEQVVLRAIDLVIRQGERLALMGANGAGKTTLLRLIAGDLFAERGRRLIGTGVTIGRFAQHQLETMDPNKTCFDEALSTASGSKPEEVRRALGAMGIGELHVARRVRTLSGGERARMALARLLLNPSALLLLDEPTNHLDLPMREALEDGLAGWPGTLLVVSHDRAFLARVTTGTLAVADARVERIEPGWDAFLAWRAARQRGGAASRSEQGERRRDDKRARAEAIQERSRRLRPLQAELQQVEAAIEADERRRTAIDDQFSNPATTSDGERMKQLVAEREQICARLPKLYSRWEQLGEEIGRISDQS
jgi:ATP-binding cassette subfamily F protein 3